MKFLNFYEWKLFVVIGVITFTFLAPAKSLWELAGVFGCVLFIIPFIAYTIFAFLDNPPVPFFIGWIYEVIINPKIAITKNEGWFYAKRGLLFKSYFSSDECKWGMFYDNIDVREMNITTLKSALDEWECEKNKLYKSTVKTEEFVEIYKGVGK